MTIHGTRLPQTTASGSSVSSAMPVLPLPPDLVFQIAKRGLWSKAVQVSRRLTHTPRATSTGSAKMHGSGCARTRNTRSHWLPAVLLLTVSSTPCARLAPSLPPSFARVSWSKVSFRLWKSMPLCTARYPPTRLLSQRGERFSTSILLQQKTLCF